MFGVKQGGRAKRRRRKDGRVSGSQCVLVSCYLLGTEKMKQREKGMKAGKGKKRCVQGINEEDKCRGRESVPKRVTEEEIYRNTCENKAINK